MFGDPSELLVQEAVWRLREENEEWPTWEDATAELMEWKELEPGEAEQRIEEAVKREEVLPQLTETHEWVLALDENTAARIGRRVLAIELARDQEEAT